MEQVEIIGLIAGVIGVLGWYQQEDYIRKGNEDVAEKSEIAIPESEEKKRSGEYELPPPPE